MVVVALRVEMMMMMVMVRDDNEDDDYLFNKMILSVSHLKNAHIVHATCWQTNSDHFPL